MALFYFAPDAPFTLPLIVTSYFLIHNILVQFFDFLLKFSIEKNFRKFSLKFKMKMSFFIIPITMVAALNV